MVQFLIDWDNFDYFVGRWGLLIELISRSILILNSVVTVFRIFKCLWEFLWSLWCLLCIWKQRVAIKFKFFFEEFGDFCAKKFCEHLFAIWWESFMVLVRIFWKSNMWSRYLAFFISSVGSSCASDLNLEVFVTNFLCES